MRRWVVQAMALFVLGLAASTRADLDGQLFILTSFPETLHTRFQAVFEARHPRLRVYVRNMKTPAAISYIQKRTSEPVDVIWVSAPDALEVLKESGHLVQLFDGSTSDAQIGGYPLDDPDGYYRGFAVSGYGIMWNEEYLKRLGLQVPARWGDLRQPAYHRHIGMSAPSRSGTTHLIVEIMLQSQGWTEGWATLLEIGGNLATVTARSYGVVEGVKDGHFGLGLVIDYLGLSARALGAPVDFVYPDVASFLPASIAMVNRASNRAAATAFIAFLLSPEGQRLLFEPEIRRLPVRQDLYKEAPTDYPNPFDAAFVRKGIRFDKVISGTRYDLVNTLFDILITDRVNAFDRPLNRVWEAIHQAEEALGVGGSVPLRTRLDEARRLVRTIPVSAGQARDPRFTGCFITKKPGFPPPPCQQEWEATWEKFTRSKQETALRLAREVLAEVRP
jgi:ABC-type Fe3+ transport system substrate-binding protein